MFRRVLFIVLAIGISGAAALLVHVFLTSHPRPSSLAASQPGKAPTIVRVLVAGGDLPMGARVRSADFRWQDWPVTSAETYIREGQSRLSDFDGAVLRSRLTAGEPVLPGEVAKPGERGFMAAVLLPGDSAVTVAVTPSTGMAGFIIPGDRVDLLLTTTVATGQNAQPRRVGRTLLSNLRVVGVDQTFTDEHRTDKKDLVVPKTVTLEVTPKQAEIVAVASDLGVISLSLRSLGNSAGGASPTSGPTWDNEVTDIAPTPIQSLPTGSRIVVARVGNGVRVFRGGQGADPALPSPPSLPATSP